MADHQADLVHVRGDHDPLRVFGLFGRLLMDNKIAQRIYFDLIGKWLDLGPHKFADFILVS